MQQAKKSVNPTKVNLLVDFAILVVLLVAAAPRFTGIAIHEWLGLAFGTAILTHLLLHWQWIVTITQKLFAKATGPHRLNYALNLLLFVDITLVTLSGVMISQSALPALGIALGQGFAWRGLHTLSADAFIVLAGLHVGLHWQWVVTHVKHYVIEPLTPARRAAVAQHNAPGKLVQEAKLFHKGAQS